MLFVVLLLSILVASSYQQQTCNVAFQPAISNTCPTGLTQLSPTLCCPNANVVPCVDLTNPQTGQSDCAKNANLCNNSVYLSVMKVQCKKTCGFCLSSTGTPPAPAPPSTCVDKINPTTGRSDCPMNVGLCTNAIYRTVMEQQCPKTCKFC